MNPRFVGLILSLGIIAFAVVGLIFVAKITAIGGAAYDWEYIPPIGMLVAGVGLFAYWLSRIIRTR